jgi:hypothetical protein
MFIISTISSLVWDEQFLSPMYYGKKCLLDMQKVVIYIYIFLKNALEGIEIVVHKNL